MKAFRDFAIKSKLLLATMMTASVAILLTVGAWMVHEMTASRKMAEQDLSAQARIIGDNCAAALEFDDARTAQETLASLKTRADIVAACVYRPDGSALACYPAGAATLSTKSPQVKADGQRFEGRDLLMFRRVIRKGQFLGTVYLRSNLQPHYSRLAAGVTIALGTMAVSLILAYLLATRMNSVVSKPIMNLATVADQVRVQQDYKLRATKYGRDEIGSLTDGFNRMLEQIQERDTKLHDAYRDLQFSEQRFRQLAESITEVFWLTTPEKDKMLYVSPGYEAIWGRTCVSLRDDPRSWLEAIHVEDRERVMHAAMNKQMNSTYDEEYRIVRPDGTVRWIHDRAFPIRNADNRIYRIAGIAEDITPRKEFEETLRKLSGRLLQLQDEERRHIARELHDSTAQNLSGLTMYLGAIKNSGVPLDTQAQKNLGKALELAKECLRELRTMSYLLHPPLLDDQGLPSALRWLVDGFMQRSELHVDLEVPSDLQRLPRDIETALFRIVQESLSNVHRHAGSSTAQIRLSADSSAVHLEVQDTGCGFVIAKDDDHNVLTLGIGITGMRERVRQLGGRMKIDSGRQGTTVQVTLPLNGGS